MKSIGTFLILAGILSSVLYFMEYDLRILRWMYRFSDMQQWLIRGGLIVVGLVFVMLGNKKGNSN